MGARSPVNTRTLRSGFKCEFCGRHSQSADALKSHQRTLHAIAIKERDKKLAKTPLKPKNVVTSKVQKSKKGSLDEKDCKPTPKIAVKNMALDKAKPSVEPEESNEKGIKTAAISPSVEAEESKVKGIKNDTKRPSVEAEESKGKGIKSAANRKVEFQCPKCSKIFPVYFSAQRHIQKVHCLNENGEKVNPDSPDLVKPIVIQLCIRCNVKYTDTHNCAINEQTLPSMSTYKCIGCLQTFPNLKMFKVHVNGVHSDGLETMFFPIEEEFNKWKEEMESHTQSSYVIMAKFNTKHIFCCSHTTETSEDVTHLCPSIILYQEFSKGIQVHFYSSHSGHNTKRYTLSNKYKSYSIADLLEQAAVNDIADEGDLYIQFKSLMENIILGAAKINIDTLKILVSKAEDMSSILSHYDEEEKEVDTPNRSYLMLNRKKKDGNVTKTGKVTETVVIKGTKRKAEIEVKREDSPILQKVLRKTRFSLADDKDDEKILKELDRENVVVNNLTKTQSPSSFNDSYKEFIDQNTKAKDKKSTTTNTTKMKKKVVKTRMGQFKPSTSPRSAEKRASAGKIEDIEYEVRERENDCNILVLKI